MYPVDVHILIHRNIINNAEVGGEKRKKERKKKKGKERKEKERKKKEER